MAYATVRSVTSVTSVTPSCTRSVSIPGLGLLCFLFFVFPSRPLPLTPPGRVFPGDEKRSALLLLLLLLLLLGAAPTLRRCRIAVPS